MRAVRMLALRRMLLCMALMGCTPAPTASSGDGGTGGSFGVGTGSPNSCIPGASVQCWCTDGSTGAQLCLRNGTFGVCSCSGGSVGSDTSAPAPQPDAGFQADAGASSDAGIVADPGSPDPGPPPACDVPTFSPFSAHITTAGIPSDPADYNCDANADGLIGASDGDFNTFVPSLETAGIDLATVFQSAIENRDEILLVELAGYGGGDATGFSVNMLYGVELASQPDPSCLDLGGGLCTWGISQSSLDSQTCKRLNELPGASVVGTQLSAGPGTFHLDLPMDLQGSVVPAAFLGGRISGIVSGQLQVTQGRLCGRFSRAGFLASVTALCGGAAPKPTICGVEPILPTLLTCAPDSCLGGACQLDLGTACAKDADCTQWCSFVMSFEAVPVSGLVLGG